MSSRCVLDLETVANERAGAWWNTVEISAPSNYKNQEKIEAYIKEKRSQLGSKSALTWWTGKVFSYAICDVEDDDDIVFEYSIDERTLLSKLSRYIHGREVYTKSGKGFDFPFLVGRYLANNLPLPHFLVQKTFQHDVDDFFSWSQSCSQRTSLNAYAHGLGIDAKAGNFQIVSEVYYDLLSGEDAADKVEQLKKYNIQDVLIVREMVRRYYNIGGINADQ